MLIASPSPPVPPVTRATCFVISLVSGKREAILAHAELRSPPDCRSDMPLSTGILCMLQLTDGGVRPASAVIAWRSPTLARQCAGQSSMRRSRRR